MSRMGGWRILRAEGGDGASHMAADEAMFQTVTAGHSPPTLRLYSCRPPCLSLGADQEAYLADFEACAALGWEVVRRPTPGRSFLYADGLA
jgi:lipoate-protein ligase A